MASDALDVVRKLASDGATHFHASYVAKQAHIPLEDAQRRLDQLRKQGVIDVHFEVLCPGCDRTLKSFDLGEKIPLGEKFDDDWCDVEPFELNESDLLVTYSPSREGLLKLNREKAQQNVKKKTPLRRHLRKIFSRLRLFMAWIRRGRSSTSSMSSTAQVRRSRRHKPIAQR